jgi:polysaccharide biosynthesis/export protein
MGLAQPFFFTGFMRIKAIVALLLLSPLFALPGRAQEAPAPSSDQAVLSPGDSVRIVVWRKPEFSGDFVVAPDGTITHPLFRAVRVAGIPFGTAEASVRRFLARFEENPEFVMEPLIRVAVSGQVGRPQVFAIRPETSVAEAVARAGGVTERGATSGVRVLRLDANGRQQEIRVDLNDPSRGSGLIPVRSGDQIVVPVRKSFVRDILLPTLGVIGSIASVGLLIDRVGNRN